MSLQASKKVVSVAKTTASRSVATASSQTYTEQQAKLGRPVSPHVEIYSFPITAISSISNRFTGMGMSAGFAAGSAFALIGGDVTSAIHAAQTVIPGFAPISKFFVAFPLTYHTLAAIRQEVWDNKPEFINNADSPKMSMAIFAGAGVISVGSMAITLKQPQAEEE